MEEALAPFDQFKYLLVEVWSSDRYRCPQDVRIKKLSEDNLMQARAKSTSSLPSVFLTASIQM